MYKRINFPAMCTVLVYMVYKLEILLMRFDVIMFISGVINLADRDISFVPYFANFFATATAAVIH